MAGIILNSSDIYELFIKDDELPSLENSPERKKKQSCNISKVVNDTQGQDLMEEKADEKAPHSSFVTESNSLTFFEDACSERTNGELHVHNEKRKSLGKSNIKEKKRQMDKSTINAPTPCPSKRLKKNDDSCVDDLGRENEIVICIPLKQVTESQKKLAKVVSCDHCERVPLDPYVSDCGHVFCKNCMEKIAESGHQCANRGKNLQYTEINISLDNIGIYKALVNTFMFKCKNHCDFVGTAKDLQSHELVCAVEVQDEMLGDFRGHGEKRLKLDRLIENLIEYIDQYCEDNNICKEFTLFYSLRRFLKLNGDKRRVALLMKLWKDGSEEGRHLSPDECLALKVFNGYGNKMYQCYYAFLKRHLCISYLKSPKQVEQLEQLFYPPSTDFSLECERKFLLYKRIIDECVEPSDLGELISCNGYRWKLAAAIAKTLQEIAFEFKENCSNQPNAMFTVMICDRYNFTNGSKLWRSQENSNNAKFLFQYSFCIVSVSLIVDGEKTLIYSKEDGDLIFRTIAVSLPDDSLNNKMKILRNPIEEEKRNLIDKKLIVRLPNGLPSKFSLCFPSVVDCRYENLKSVLLESFDVNEYDEFCSFCDSNAKSWPENIGSCTTNINLAGNLAQCALKPFNFDVNFVKLFLSVLIHESSGVYKSINQCNDHEIELLNSGMQKIQSVLMLKYSIQPDSLILEPHKYVNRFLENVLQANGVLDLIVDKSRQTNIRQMFWRYFELRSVYVDFNSGNTSLGKQVRLKSFKYRAVIWMKFIWAKFPYVKASSYLHLLVEHVEDMLQMQKFPGKSTSRSEVDGSVNISKSLLIEYLKSAWLKSSPYLRKINLPFQMGHGTKKCPDV